MKSHSSGVLLSVAIAPLVSVNLYLVLMNHLAALTEISESTFPVVPDHVVYHHPNFLAILPNSKRHTSTDWKNVKGEIES